MTGIIRQAGFYSDCLPSLVIKIKKEEAPYLECSNNVRMPLTIDINGIRYRAGMRTTPNMDYIKICADIEAEDGTPARLVEVLLSNGFAVNQQVALQQQDESLVISNICT